MHVVCQLKLRFIILDEAYWCIYQDYEFMDPQNTERFEILGTRGQRLLFLECRPTALGRS